MPQAPALRGDFYNYFAKMLPAFQIAKSVDSIDEGKDFIDYRMDVVSANGFIH